MNVKDFALQMIGSNPNMRNNPQAQELLKIIQSGDNARGEQLAKSLCNANGVSTEDAISQARNFFNI